MNAPGTAPAGATLHALYERSPADPRRAAVGRAGLPPAASDATAPWALVRDAPVQGHAMASCLLARMAPHAADLGGGALSSGGGATPTVGGGRAPLASGSLTHGRGASYPPVWLPCLSGRYRATHPAPPGPDCTDNVLERQAQAAPAANPPPDPWGLAQVVPP